MKFIISLLLTAALSFALGLYFPWWTIAIAAFAVSIFIIQRPGLSFLSAFLAVFLLWGLMAMFISNANQHILANRLAPVIIKSPNIYLLMLATGIIGGLVAGFAALAASFARQDRR